MDKRENEETLMQKKLSLADSVQTTNQLLRFLLTVAGENLQYIRDQLVDIQGLMAEAARAEAEKDDIKSKEE